MRAPLLFTLLALVTAAPAEAQRPRAADPAGVWESPGGNTRIRIARCGRQWCGTVAWASDTARADAARAGHPDLVGMELFEGFRRTGPKSFEGQVFVPDLNRRLNGELTLIDRQTIEVRGCLFGRLGCRTERWTRSG